MSVFTEVDLFDYEQDKAKMLRDYATERIGDNSKSNNF